MEGAVNSRGRDLYVVEVHRAGEPLTVLIGDCKAKAESYLVPGTADDPLHLQPLVDGRLAHRRICRWSIDIDQVRCVHRNGTLIHRHVHPSGERVPREVGRTARRAEGDYD